MIYEWPMNFMVHVYILGKLYWNNLTVLQLTGMPLPSHQSLNINKSIVSISNNLVMFCAKVHWPLIFNPYCHMKIFASEPLGILCWSYWEWQFHLDWSSLTFDLEVWPLTPIAWWKYMAINFYPAYQITLPLNIPRWSYGWKIAYSAKCQWTLTLNFHILSFVSCEHVS